MQNIFSFLATTFFAFTSFCMDPSLPVEKTLRNLRSDSGSVSCDKLSRSGSRSRCKSQSSSSRSVSRSVSRSRPKSGLSTTESSITESSNHSSPKKRCNRLSIGINKSSKRLLIDAEQSDISLESSVTDLSKIGLGKIIELVEDKDPHNENLRQTLYKLMEKSSASDLLTPAYRDFISLFRGYFPKNRVLLDYIDNLIKTGDQKNINTACFSAPYFISYIHLFKLAKNVDVKIWPIIRNGIILAINKYGDLKKLSTFELAMYKELERAQTQEKFFFSWTPMSSKKDDKIQDLHEVPEHETCPKIPKRVSLGELIKNPKKASKLLKKQEYKNIKKINIHEINKVFTKDSPHIFSDLEDANNSLAQQFYRLIIMKPKRMIELLDLGHYLLKEGNYSACGAVYSAAHKAMKVQEYSTPENYKLQSLNKLLLNALKADIFEVKNIPMSSWLLNRLVINEENQVGQLETTANILFYAKSAGMGSVDLGTEIEWIADAQVTNFMLGNPEQWKKFENYFKEYGKILLNCSREIWSDKQIGFEVKNMNPELFGFMTSAQLCGIDRGTKESSEIQQKILQNQYFFDDFSVHEVIAYLAYNEFGYEEIVNLLMTGKDIVALGHQEQKGIRERKKYEDIFSYNLSNALEKRGIEQKRAISLASLIANARKDFSLIRRKRAD